MSLLDFKITMLIDVEIMCYVRALDLDNCVISEDSEGHNFEKYFYMCI